MDLEFNVIGFGYTKSCSGINLLHFGTTLVYWASLWGLILDQSTVKDPSEFKGTIDWDKLAYLIGW